MRNIDHKFSPPSSGQKPRLNYRTAGVDIEEGDAFVEAIKPLAKATSRVGAIGGLGGFGALFDLKAAGLKDPVLVSTTDGVGTKLKIAIEVGQHGTVGIDLVAMCVNDLIVQGAEPLFFLDYFATGKLSASSAHEVIAGITKGCIEAGCALVGGETAEMPDMYSKQDYDLAGFAVGAAERERILPHDVLPGDVILGLSSTGLHSNGFSLVRKIIASEGLTWVNDAPFQRDRSLGEALLTPTRIYVRPVIALHHAGLLKGAAHITGGGISGNLSRILPAGMQAVLNVTWEMPSVFSWIAAAGRVEETEMLQVFNCGIGMILIVAEAEPSIRLLRKYGESVHVIGQVGSSDHNGRVLIRVPDQLFRQC